VLYNPVEYAAWYLNKPEYWVVYNFDVATQLLIIYYYISAAICC